MFVSMKKYTKLKLELYEYQLAAKLSSKANEMLLTAIKGQNFSQDDIKNLISLCHPDKHNNSDKATEITKKLLELKCW